MLTNQEEKDRAIKLKQMGLQFKKARFAPKDERYPNTIPGMVKLIVPDKNDVDVPYLCSEEDLNDVAKHLVKGYKSDSPEE